MHERGYDAVWIELEVVRLVLIAAQRQHMLLRLLALLLQRDAHLLCTDRIDIVVELQHLVLLDAAPFNTSPAGAYAFTALWIVKEDALGLADLHGRARAWRNEVMASPSEHTPGHQRHAPAPAVL